MIAARNCGMWFGTKEYSGWIPTPLSGANVSPDAWGDSGTFLNGGGYAINSRNSHKTYDFSWRKSSTREFAQLMKSYYDGTYGRGKLYFHDPLTYTTNVLPARWADPSITTRFEGPALVPHVIPSMSPTSGFRKNRLPVKTAYFDLTGTPSIEDLVDNKDIEETHYLYIPIPEGMELHLGAFFTAEQGAGVYVCSADESGAPTPDIQELTPLDNDSDVLFPDSFSGVSGVYLWISHDGLEDYPSIELTAMHGRLSEIGRPVQGEPFWIGGQGNAGVRFEGPPSYTNHTGVNGGQVELGAVFIESEI